MSGEILGELLRLLLVAAGCTGILALAEVLRGLRRLQPEATRKLVHVSMGLLAASFPWIFHSPSTVAALCLAVALVLAWSRLRHTLLSVNGVMRRSWGTVYYPLAIALVFLLARGRPQWYVASVLVLTVSDTLAAIVGQVHGRHVYRIGADRKSLEGSLAFFVSALACAYVPLSLGTASLGRAVWAESLFEAACVAVVATFLEAEASAGADNLLIPVGTCVTLVCLSEGEASRQAVAALALGLAAGAAWLVRGAAHPVALRAAATARRTGS